MKDKGHGHQSEHHNTPSSVQPVVRVNFPDKLAVDLPDVVTGHFRHSNDDRPSNNLREWITAGVQLGALVAAVWLGVLTLKTLGATREATKVANRAYLECGKPELFGPGIKIPINNVGHVPASIISVELTYQRVTRKNEFLDERSIVVPGSGRISPGAATRFILPVTIPKLSAEREEALKAVPQFIAIHGNVTFDAGFGMVDTLFVNVSDIGGSWHNVDEGFQVDLNNGTVKK
jgi:hypothetical protein